MNEGMRNAEVGTTNESDWSFTLRSACAHGAHCFYYLSLLHTAKFRCAASGRTGKRPSVSPSRRRPPEQHESGPVFRVGGRVSRGEAAAASRLRGRGVTAAPPAVRRRDAWRRAGGLGLARLALNCRRAGGRIRRWSHAVVSLPAKPPPLRAACPPPASPRRARAACLLSRVEELRANESHEPPRERSSISSRGISFRNCEGSEASSSP